MIGRFESRKTNAEKNSVAAALLSESAIKRESRSFSNDKKYAAQSGTTGDPMKGAIIAKRKRL